MIYNMHDCVILLRVQFSHFRAAIFCQPFSNTVLDIIYMQLSTAIHWIPQHKYHVRISTITLEIPYRWIS